MEKKFLDKLIEQVIYQKINEVAPMGKNVAIGKGSRLPQINIDPSFRGEATQGQELIQKISARLVGGETPKERIISLVKIFTPQGMQEFLNAAQDTGSDGIADDQIAAIFSALAAYSMLYDLTQNYNETTMGWIFENWVTALISGATQTGGEGTATDFTQKIGDVIHYYSNKLYTAGKGDISQAKDNVLALKDQSINYVVGVKDRKTKPNIIKFYEVIYSVQGTDDGDGSAQKPYKLERLYKQTVKINDLVKQNPYAKINFSVSDKFLESKKEELDKEVISLIGWMENTILNMNNLKVFLGTYFQTFDQAAATGAKESAENALKNFNLLAGELKGKGGDQGSLKNQPANQQDILKRNKDILGLEKFPGFDIEQAFNNFAGNDKNPKQGFEIISRINKTIAKKTPDETIKSFIKFVNSPSEILGEPQPDNLKSAFNYVILLQNLMTLILNFDSQQGQGFSFEAWLASVMGLEVAGGNQELEDIVKTKRDEEGKLTGIEFYSAKSLDAPIIEQKLRISVLKYILDLDKQKYQNLFDISNELIDDFYNDESTKANAKKETYGEEGFANKLMKLENMLGAYGIEKEQYVDDMQNDNPKIRAEAAKQFIKIVKDKFDKNPKPLRDALLTSGAAVIKMGKKTKTNFDLERLKKKYNLDNISTVDDRGVPITYYSVVKQSKQSVRTDKVFGKVGQPYKLIFYKNTFYSEELGKLRKPTVKDESGEILGSIEFGKEYFGKILDTITELVGNTKANFTEVFEQFNGFQTSVYTYFQDPSTTSSAIALRSYNKMKKKVNDSFGKAGFEAQKINETLDHLIKLIVKQKLLK